MKEELKKLIEKAGTLKLLAVVICGVLLLFFSYSENADEKAKAVATDIAPANSQGGVYQVLEAWLDKNR